MIDLKTLSADWIAEKRKKYKKDPSLMESMIYALYLLEQVKQTGLEFIFKGGTSLILLMKEPRRFSVDIDIVVSPKIGKEELEGHLSKIAQTSAFTRMELDEKRSYQGDIPRAHYKFIYNSNFAPNTTGVPYNSEKEKEILKQLFDIGNLFDLLTDIAVFKKSFLETVKEEIAYRPERNIESVEQVLQDIVDTALLIAKKDILKTVDEKSKFAEINTGINQFRHFVFTGKFEILEAQVAAAKAAYLAAFVLRDHKENIKRFSETIPLTDYLITNAAYNFLNKRLKFVAKGEALYYWYQTVKLLTDE